VRWRGVDFGPLEYGFVMRLMIVSVTMIATGVQLALAGFLAGVMEMERP
jgi:hypothetical protein